MTLWILFVVGVSLLPITAKRRLGTSGALHSTGHLIVFVVTGALLCYPRRSFVTRLGFAGLAILLGFGLECAEWLLFHNGLEWRDVRLDSLGVVIGFGLTMLARAPDRL